MALHDGAMCGAFPDTTHNTGAHDMYDDDLFGFGWEYFDTAIDNDLAAWFRGEEV